MPTLEELAVQGDSATLQREERAKTIKLMGPQKFYERWERHSSTTHFPGLVMAYDDELNTSCAKLSGGPLRAPSRGLRHVVSLDGGGRRPHARQRVRLHVTHPRLTANSVPLPGALARV